MTEHDFNDLIAKYHQGKATDEEKALLNAWFDSIERTESALTWNKTDEDCQFAAIRRKIKASDVPAKVIPFYSAKWFQIAATVLLLISSSYAMWHIAIRNETIIVASLPDHPEKVILPDGTLVWLRGNSTLQFPERFDDNARTVSLSGEALFEVSKDPLHPFVIRCGSLRAKVLGTSFNIKASEKDIALMVLTGKVELADANNQNSVVVLPNHKVMYDGTRQEPEPVVEASEKVRVMKGTEYNMAFSNTTMDDILERIEGKFNTKITVDNTALGNCLITADFTDQSLEDTLRMMAHILGFEYKITPNTIVITGGGCNG